MMPCRSAYLYHVSGANGSAAIKSQTASSAALHCSSETAWETLNITILLPEYEVFCTEHRITKANHLKRPLHNVAVGSATYSGVNPTDDLISDTSFILLQNPLFEFGVRWYASREV